MERYYTEHGMAHDAILRCADCGTLVSHADLVRRGTCACGTRRVKEVTTLSLWEWMKVRVGLIRFPYRREFIREFTRAR